MRAASTYRRAEEMAERAAQRREQIAYASVRARVRADQLRTRRIAALGRRPRGEEHVAPFSADGRVLDTARVLAGLSVHELWLRYVAVGGSSSVGELADALGGAAVDRFDHDLIAVALNEQFADAGFGRPLDYWSSERA
jgi:hypothetical protein